ncbi:polysaccharide deacetylase family protein [Anaerorhabdus sp.]|uniref:polysaccharide deacetylase family protein n=1 Tax=Anaerorhabdus sp. TaxID=1872524 RepID=UPI002FC843D2
MISNSTIRNKKIAIVFVFIALICGISLSIMLINDYIPEPLKQVSEHTEKVKYIKKIGKKFSVVVYYPTLDNNLNDIVYNEANEVFNEIIEQKDDFIKDNKSTMVLVDYQYDDISTSLAQIKYNIQVLNEDTDSQYVKSIMLDKNTGSTVDTTAVFDDVALRLLRQNLRNMAKADENLKELAFSREFLEVTANNKEVFSNFYVEGTELVFKIDLFENQVIEFRQNGEEIANHIALDLGITQTIEDPVVYIPMRYVDPNRPMVALTFDDGPHVQYTSEILSTLREYDSAATFFILGNRIGNNSRYTVLDTIESGSEVGSHSWSHPYLVKTKDKDLDLQFYGTSNKVYEDVSQWCYQIKLFRPPYGAINKRVSEQSPYPFIMWSMDTLDWKTRDVQTTVDTILNDVKDGDIILMHDIHLESKDAAIQVIPMLIDKGYQLVTVSEMMAAKGITMENGVRYSKAR